MKATLLELARLTGGTVVGDETILLVSVNPAHSAGEDSITFLDDPKHKGILDGSRAGAVVVPRSVSEMGGKPLLQVDNVQSAFHQIAAFFRPPREKMMAGISPAASIAESARLGEGTTVGPGVTIGADVTIGRNCEIHPNVVILDGTVIGDETTIFPNVTIYENNLIGARCLIHAGAVIGAYGFGYDSSATGHKLSEQLGNVEIGDDVEIGANATVDRATHGSTRIGTGTKIDNLVMIAHNCSIGRFNLICAHTGVAGSCVTGDYVVMAGRVGVRDHLKIGVGAVLGAMAGVMADVPEKARIVGIPATPEKEQMKKQVALAKLPDMRREFIALQRETARLAEEMEKIQKWLADDGKS